jgi:hypothetical protein
MSFFDSTIFDSTMMNSLGTLALGFLINLAIALLIVRGIYNRGTEGKNSIFTFIAFNTVIYFVMTFLSNTELSVGVGFGLFAIFSILRYRTTAISTREMTYLFILIALPVMNSVLMGDGNWVAMLVANGTVVAVLYVLERGWGFHYEGMAFVRYDRIELIKPINHHLLYQDLRQRLGLPIKRFEIGRINLVEDTVELTLYYDEPDVQEQRHDFSVSYIQNSYLSVEGK